MNTTASTPILDHLSALGDETRTRILVLLERSEFTVSELCSVLQTPQPSVSRHLKTLTSEGWVEARSEGRSRHYRLAPQLESGARDLWAVVREQIEGTGVYATDAERAREVMHERRQRSTAFFADAAERWDDLRADLFGDSATFAPLLGLLDPNWTVGDLGAGTGALSEVLAPFVRRVVCVDRSEEMLSAARLRLEARENAELRQGELERLPVEDGELDVALLALVLHYVVDPEVVLKEVQRALSPGGSVLIVDMREHERGVGYAEHMGHVWPGFELDQVEAWLTAAGFSSPRLVPLRVDPDASGPPLFLASAWRS